MDFLFRAYPSRQALAEALAAGVAAVLSGGIATKGRARLAVSGGSTPKLFFETLAKAEIDWADVTVTLIDERWVGEDSSRSNAALVKRHLMQGPAARAHFLPLYVEGLSPDDAQPRLSALLRTFEGPFDAAILGMGGDGHTASFFPGADTLEWATNPQCSDPVVPVRAEGAEEPRVTLSLPAFIDARLLALHIEGEEKKAVFDKARADGPTLDLPIRSVLRAKRETPLEVFWAP
ncbi:6-phosphogluconolactonase [Consotaella salsifontis]|uniref:6-phosphogluconolactonase n=1 Tax=Consotaella salsifontis TaxID=1365950 RepID=A0A1T4Q2S0_9HYPH|nr:6-phosphogluconolactonase [Consotaella salsifontis]SJZ97936.1 6-phosphogluconolactonase [Consotaella salsifontis]